MAYSQALRLRKICHLDLDSQHHNADLKPYLVQKRYDGEEVQFHLNKASGTKRSELLSPKFRKAQQIMPLVVTSIRTLLTCPVFFVSANVQLTYPNN